MDIDKFQRQLDRIEKKIDKLIAALSEDEETTPSVDLEGNEYESGNESDGTLS